MRFKHLGKALFYLGVGLIPFADTHEKSLSDILAESTSTLTCEDFSEAPDGNYWYV